MRVLALILARGGSKRIPDKNIRPLGGKPLIVWSIDSVRGIEDICDILVSTDDARIGSVAEDAGALVPWLRPAELATDESTSIDAALHALDWYEGERGAVDGLLLLQPTSPFRSRETVRRGLDLFRQQHRPVLGVSPALSHPLWCYKLEGDRLRPYVEGVDRQFRSQDLPPVYVVNGAFYLFSPGDLRRSRAFRSDDTLPLVIDDPRESLDIDNEWDWQIAEAVL